MINGSRFLHCCGAVLIDFYEGATTQLLNKMPSGRRLRHTRPKEWKTYLKQAEIIGCGFLISSVTKGSAKEAKRITFLTENGYFLLVELPQSYVFAKVNPKAVKQMDGEKKGEKK